MIPILFSENSTAFTTNGIGRLADAISCVVTEERNGMYELEMEYPIDGQHFEDIAIRSIVAVVPCDGGTIQAFRIYKITKPINGRVIISAHHISYDLSKNTAMPFSVASSASACATTLARLKSNAVENCPFTFWTDVTTAGAYTQTVPASIKSRLGGVEGSVLDQFGGEFEWDNYTVKLHRQRGTLAVNNGITLRYGKNITDITQEENITNTATGVVPFWVDLDGNLVTLPERAVYSPNASKYTQKLTVPLDLSDNWEEAPTVAELRAAAQVVVNASAFGVPTVSIEVSFVALWQTDEYKDIAPLQRVKLCDEVTVSFEKLRVDAVAKIVKTEYDVLAERYLSVQIGSIRSNLATTLNDQTAQTLKEIEAQAVSTSQAINNATKWLTSAGGYVIAIKNTDGTWKELIFSNMTDPYSSSAKILRINNNGIGFSLNGMNGTFTNAWTIDGNLVADFITTGTMSAARIKGGTLQLGGNNNANGVLQILNASGSQIGKWDKDGISVSSGTIAGPTIRAGGNNNANGIIQVLNASGTAVVTLNASGLTVSAGSIAGPSITLGGSNNASGTLVVKNASGTNVITLNNSGITLNSGSINIANKFTVDSSGKVTATEAAITGAIKATSGEIGSGNNKFTIEGNHIKSGKSSLTDGNNGVYVGTDGIALGQNSKFKVDNTGVLTATGATINGSLTTANNGNTTYIGDGRIDISMGSGNRNSIHIKRGGNELSIGPTDVTWSDNDELYVQANWADILAVAKGYHEHGQWWSD